MYRVFFLVFLLATTASAEPLTFWWYSGRQLVIVPAIECAAKRIQAATCLPLDVSFTAQHWVSEDPPEKMNGYSGLTWGPYDTAKVKLNDTLSPAAVCPVLVHEFIHILTRNYGHPREDYSFGWPTVHTNPAHPTLITESDVTAICAVKTCGCFNPEGP